MLFGVATTSYCDLYTAIKVYIQAAEKLEVRGVGFLCARVGNYQYAFYPPPPFKRSFVASFVSTARSTSPRSSAESPNRFTKTS